MNGRNTKLGGLLGLTLAVSALGMAGCDPNDSGGDGGILGGITDIAKACGLSCPEAGEGVAAGNASITGSAGIDSFFRAVVNYNNVATTVSADIDAELAGIQSLFGITDAELKAQATLGAAINAKLKSQFNASVVVNAQPAKCSVDAKVTAQATVKCQAAANCEVDKGKATLQCMGTCNVDANVSGSCDANATLRCNVTAPSFACKGECSGTCSVQTPTVNCAGTCRGTCMGTCSAAGDADGNGVTAAGECVGSCTGTCMAGCEVTGMAALNCQGNCNGSCEYTPAMGGCDARAEVSCDIMASAQAECSGRCEGEFIPPKVQCDASASCEASAKAEAKFQVQCTPPTVEVKVVAQGGVMAQAQVDFLVAQLKARLPRLSAAAARAKFASDAAAELGGAGKVAIQSSYQAVANGNVEAVVKAKILTCVPEQLGETQQVLTSANATLNARLSSADSVAKAFAMVM